MDNCPRTVGDLTSFGDQYGPFSTVFGTLSRAEHTIGPFDPIYPYDTMLSDGILDWGDAPMPAAQIDVDIAENDGQRRQERRRVPLPGRQERGLQP